MKCKRSKTLILGPTSAEATWGRFFFLGLWGGRFQEREIVELGSLGFIYSPEIAKKLHNQKRSYQDSPKALSLVRPGYKNNLTTNKKIGWTMTPLFGPACFGLQIRNGRDCPTAAHIHLATRQENGRLTDSLAAKTPPSTVGWKDATPCFQHVPNNASTF